MRLNLRWFTRALMLAGALSLMAVGAASKAPLHCGISWGTLPKGTNAGAPLQETGLGPVTNLRAGRHPCFDRLIVDIKGNATPGYTVKYLGGPRQDPMPIRGGARLFAEVAAGIGTPGECYHGDWLLGRPPNQTNRTEVVNVDGYQSFRQVMMYNEATSIIGGVQGCGTRSLILGGTTGVGIGVRARLPFRAFIVPGGRAGGERLVIDVAHSW